MQRRQRVSWLALCQRTPCRPRTKYACFVWRWWRKSQPTLEPNDLRGAPAQRRLKTYSAVTGIVYQYFYRGYRATGLRLEDAEYVFQATADRKHFHLISVIVTREALREWSAWRGRGIIESEKYAVAKLSLFAAFDDERTSISEGNAIRPDAREIDMHLETLGRL